MKNKDKPFYTKEYSISTMFSIFGNDSFYILPTINIANTYIEFLWLKGYIMFCTEL